MHRSKRHGSLLWVGVALAAQAGCGDDDMARLDSGTPPSDAASVSGDASDSLDAMRPPVDAAAPVDSPAVPFDAATTPTVITGTIRTIGAATVPAGAKVVVIWQVSSGSPDYSYKLGEGTVSGASFSVTLPTPPVIGALNDYGGGQTLGVGIVALVPGTLAVADGRLARADLDALRMTLIGGSVRSAVIWRTGPFTTSGFVWPGAFPEAEYGCGVCMDTMMTFDTFVPGACSSLEVLVGDLSGVAGCNWT